MSESNHFDLEPLPVWPQSQASLSDQTAFLVQVANRLGLYDAADAVKQLIPRLGEVRHGYHVDDTQEIIGDLYVSLYDLHAHAKALKVPHRVNLQIAEDALDAARQYIERVELKGSAQ